MVFEVFLLCVYYIQLLDNRVIWRISLLSENISYNIQNVVFIQHHFFILSKQQLIKNWLWKIICSFLNSYLNEYL